MKQKHFGMIGISIPFLFFIGMLIYYAFFNFNALININNVPLILHTLNDVPGSKWMAYYNQIFIGILMLIFTAFLLKKTDNSITNLIGKLFLFVSSLGWTLSGLFPFFVKSDDEFIEYAINLTALVIGCGILGFITISSEFEKIYDSKILKKLILVIGILISVEGVFNFIFIDQYPTIISKIMWLIYFSGFGIIGYAIFIKASTQQPSRLIARFSLLREFFS